MNWPDRIDRLVNFLKWPAAWMALCATPFLVYALLCLALRVVVQPWPLLPFLLGAVLLIFLWRRFLGGSRIGRFLITLEHESTHALFAMLCLHRIVGFRASLGRGGEVRFTGRGNWLIMASPYFFPTAAILLFLIAYLMPFPLLPWQRFLLGVALGYHIVSTYRETHRDQTDLVKLGKVFCWMFLPAANLLVVAALVAFAHSGSEGLSEWFADIIAPARWTFSEIWEWFRPVAEGSAPPSAVE